MYLPSNLPTYLKIKIRAVLRYLPLANPTGVSIYLSIYFTYPTHDNIPLVPYTPLLTPPLSLKIPYLLTYLPYLHTHAYARMHTMHQPRPLGFYRSSAHPPSAKKKIPLL